MCAGQAGWDGGDGVTLPGEQAIKCAAWASRPLVSGPGHYMGSCLPRGTRTAKTLQQDRTGRPISAEILLERKRRKEVKGVKRYSVDLAFQTLLHTGIEFLSQGNLSAPTHRGTELWPPRYEAAAVFIQDTIVRESGRFPFFPETVHLDK